jgi:hypothetical protein
VRHQHQLDQKDDPDQRADRQILQKALAQLGEIHIEHHDDEQEQHHDRADIDDDQDHREKFGAEQQKQARRVHEGEDQVQHRVHRIPRRDHHEGGRARHDREEIEEERGDVHARVAPLPRLRKSEAPAFCAN